MAQPTVLASAFNTLGSVALIASFFSPRGSTLKVILLGLAGVFVVAGLIFTLRNRRLTKVPPAV